MTLRRAVLHLAALALILTAACHLGAPSGRATSPGKPGPSREKPVPDGPRPFIIVRASYPGANAQTVADTVAAPIEQQVNGVEGMLFQSSRCTDNGTYTLKVAFRRGVDAGQAQVLVQNRVSLALPILPETVKAEGVVVKVRPADVLLLVKLVSPAGRYDTLYLSNYATVQVKDVLARLPGVAEVTLLGERAYALRVWLDASKMAARKLAARDVVQALEGQNLHVAGGKETKAKGLADSIRLNAPGRLLGPDVLEDLVVKSMADGLVIRLKDVARVEMAAGPRSSDALLNEDPVVLLAVRPTAQALPRDLSAAVGAKVRQLDGRAPEGLRIGVAFDFTPKRDAADRPTAPEYLLLDLTLPAGASEQRTLAALKRCQAALRGVGRVRDTLALTENPFDRSRDRPCLLVRLTPADTGQPSRAEVTRAIRGRLGEVADVTFRVRDLSAPGGSLRCGYPLDLAVHGPEADRVRELAKKLAERLRKCKELTDVWANADSAPQLQIDIDRKAAERQGVSLTDLFDTFQVHLGPVPVNRFGRTWRVYVHADAHFRKGAAEIQQLQVRNRKGEMVPLGTLVKIREFQAPLALDRLNMRPAVQITANPVSGTTVARARALCEALLEEVRRELRLSAEYRLTWLQGEPAESLGRKGSGGTTSSK